MVVETQTDPCEATRRLIREDAEKAPARWKPLFAEIEKRVFDPEFRIGKARRAAGLVKDGDQEDFETCFGCSPLAYLRRRRLETVEALRRSGELGMWEVARLAGFRSAQALWHAARHLKKTLPIPEGQKETKAGPALHPPRGRAANDPASACRYALGAADDAHEAQYHHDRLEARSIFGDLAHRERPWSWTWWASIRQLPAAEQRALVVMAPFKTPVFFEHLCEKSREDGRDDRQRGVVVAELALEALVPLAKHTSEPELSHLQGKGWTVLATARWLDLDYEKAEEAFATAEKHFRIGPAPAELRAELLVSRSCLRYMQRRFVEALELANGALGLLKAPRGRLGAQILMARAQVYAVQGQAERALSDLLAAVAALDDTAEPYLIMTVRQNLASALWRLGRLEEAEECLLHARSLAARLGKVTPWYHTLWLEGLLAERRSRPELAAIQLREVCVGLRGLGSWGDFAVAALDLARVEAQRGDCNEAIVWAAQALPHLQALELEREGLAALALLRQQLAAKQLSAAVLEQLRRSVGRAVDAPELQSGNVL